MPEPLDYAAIQAEHEDHNGYCVTCATDAPVDWPCLPYRLAEKAERLAGKVAKAEAALARVEDWAVEQERPFPDGERDHEGEEVARSVRAVLTDPEAKP